MCPRFQACQTTHNPLTSMFASPTPLMCPPTAEPGWHTRDEIIAEVLRATWRYPSGTVRRILHYDFVGRSTSDHVASDEAERQGDEFHLR